MAEHCESGNNLTEDGEGMCQRPIEKTVRLSIRRNGKSLEKDFGMCRHCAAHWAIRHPRTVRVLN